MPCHGSVPRSLQILTSNTPHHSCHFVKQLWDPLLCVSELRLKNLVTAAAECHAEERLLVKHDAGSLSILASGWGTV